ncbi:MAG TPA: universal stress protein [Usitatibacter sp.]|nr:universal stress protein [Usitatibacter sp.]
MYRRILVPVDGSPTSNRGLKEALGLAKEQGGGVRLVHVVDESMAIGYAESGLDLEPMLEGLRGNGSRVLKRALDAARKAGVRAESQLYESMAGPAASIILRDARKWRAELIVMGTHGRRGIRRLVLGSDAEHVLREATVPVLLVRGR